MTIDTDTFVQEMTGWRRDLHAHPEFGFEERRTSAFVAGKLREFGLDDVAEGVGGTGVVGTLKRGSRGWFNAMAHRYMPEWSIAFLKRIYQRIRRTAKRDGQHA